MGVPGGIDREDGVGQSLGGVGDGREYGAAEDGEDDQAETAPEKLPEEVEGERQEPIGQSSRIHRQASDPSGGEHPCHWGLDWSLAALSACSSRR